jgi:uncharacterized protein YecE (DUF72 family)
LAAKGRIRIGTSGWNYDHWRGPFYPEDLSSREWLSFYARHLGSVEVNNTFYQLPRERTLRDWSDAVPSDFLFSVKASRYITHMKKLKDPKDSLEQFLARVLTLGDRLGPVLFQLPPSWKVNPERFEGFLEEMRERGRDLPTPLRCAFEFRDESWFSDEVLGLLRAHEAAFCIYDLGGSQSPREVTADFVYVRLHGPGGRYEGSYGTEALSEWAGAFSTWTRKGIDVYCYFDNDDSGYAAKNAIALAEMLGVAGEGRAG